MGYCVRMDVSVKIAEKHEELIKHIFKDLDNGTRYSWVNSGFGKYDYVEEMFEEWRYEVVKKDGFFIVEYFSGEKVGSCDVLWQALEKLVEPDSIINCIGEDGAKWRWIFKNNKFKEEHNTEQYE